ncbi:MAG TPA: hypothetical protein VJ769_03515 [Actinomycetes bacterium]|nr:hypothetical protein [Actinomycetes bacterium]
MTALDRRVMARFPTGMEFRPTLEVREVAGRIWLQLHGLAYGEGATLQEAADDLVARVLVLVMAFRSSGIGPVSGEGPLPDLAMLDFLYELGEIAAANGDIRDRLFG